MNVASGRFDAMADNRVSPARTSSAVSITQLQSYLGDLAHRLSDCTFTSTKGQRIAGAPRTKILEDRLRRARALLSKIQAQTPSAQLQAEVNSIFDSPPGSPSSASDTPGPTDDGMGHHFENMLDGRGRLTSNNKSTEYYGGSSGFAFLHQTQKLFSQDSSGSEHFSTDRHVDMDAMSKLFDSPLPDKQALATEIPFVKLLPSRQTAEELLQVVFGQTYQLLQFLHEPTFQKQTDRIYDLDPMDFEDSDHDFLPLFYMVTALGYVFNQKMHHKYGCKGTLNHAWVLSDKILSSACTDKCKNAPRYRGPANGKPGSLSGHPLLTDLVMLCPVPHVDGSTGHRSHIYRTGSSGLHENGLTLPGLL